jgi:two-component system sensor histidine kinase KdpD
MSGRGRRQLVLAGAWGIALLAAVLVLLALREHVGPGHVALVLLLVVLGASAAAGRTTGLVLAGLSFVVFNWFFLPPYGTFVIANPLDWLVLVAFLVASIVAAQLLHRAQREAAAAEARAAEVDRLATLGAETLSAGRAEDAVAAVAGVIRDAVGAASCDIFLKRADGAALVPAGGPRARSLTQAGADATLLEWVAANRSAAAVQRDGTVHLHGARPAPAELTSLGDGRALELLLPLEARGRAVGVLRVAQPDGLRLDPPRWRFLEAIAYYAALAAERVRLVADAERAEALREADRLKDALLASVSHDLRTPLTTIKALAHELQAHGDERAEIIEQEADRLNRTVADLLDLSRLNAGALAVRPELNAVDDLLGALVQRVEPALGGRRLAVALPPGEDLLFGRFDLVHALRILANLVDNAAKYAPGPAPIEIAVARDGAELAIRVSDRGPGVPPEQIGRIFEPFYRPASAAPGAGGAGLGLTIARGLAEAQGGRLTYEPRPGGGSTFTLHLPAISEADAAASPARS